MKAIILSSIFVFSVMYAAAQSNKDSIALRTDIEAISKGKEVKSKKRPSVVKSRMPQAKVDTAALKPGNTSPTPSSPNNPNPHQPVPSIINAEPPATPVAHPAPPAGTPSSGGSPKKKNRESRN